jgi:hypothetical protein
VSGGAGASGNVGNPAGRPAQPPPFRSKEAQGPDSTLPPRR